MNLYLITPIMHPLDPELEPWIMESFRVVAENKIEAVKVAGKGELSRPRYTDCFLDENFYLVVTDMGELRTPKEWIDDIRSDA